MNSLVAKAQSASGSYQMVDFVTSEASLSNSSSYQLNDSIDYYGGVHSSAGYQECTGDFAVLGNCGKVIVPTPPNPPTPPTPPVPTDGGGGAGPGYDHQDCNKVSCLGDAPKEEDRKPVDKPFHLPNIAEPSTKPEVKVAQPVIPVTVRPEVVKNEKNPVEVEKVIEKVTKTGSELVQDVLKGAALEPVCDDYICSQKVGLHQVAAKKWWKEETGEACGMYVFGGFLINAPCDLSILIWVLIALSSLFVLPVGLIRKDWLLWKRNRK